MRGANAAELTADIERRVADGLLRPGDRLPPVRALAEELGLAPNTVAAAYRRLGERGIVVGRGRAGTFVAPRPPVAVAEETLAPSGLLDVSTGNPDPDLLPSLAAAAAAAPEPRVLYSAPAVDPALAERGARWLEADGVEAGHLTVVSGALDGIERVLGAHLRPGDRVAVEDPAYASVIDLLGSMGFILVPVAIDDAGMRPDSLADALDRQVDAVLLTPRAQNPFGSALTADRARSLRTVLDRRPGLLVVEDDHASVVAGAPMNSVAGGRERWAAVRSVAKSLGPDLRLALVAGDATSISRVEGRLRLGPGWVSHMLQRMAAALLADPGVEEATRRAAAIYGERRAAMIDGLSEAGIAAHGTSGLNVWIPVTDEAAAIAGMRDRGVAVRAGARFRIRSGPGIRVTVASLDASRRASVLGALADTLAPKHVTRSG